MSTWGRQWDKGTHLIGSHVSGEGPRPCPTMLIGEFPAIEEGKRRRPFVGKSGGELTRYLNGWSLPAREDLYLTNFSKRVAPTVKEFTFSDDDERELWDEIRSVQPRTIVTLGAHCTRYFLGDVTLEQVHGIPHACTRQSGALIFPCYNPAAALHSPSLQSIFAFDMRRLSLFLKGKLPPAPADLKPGHYTLYPGTAGDTWTALPSRIAVDTEGWQHAPWCISYSGAAYTGEVVRYGNHRNWVNSVRANRPQVILHNALHDLDMLRCFGLDLDAEGIRFEDTMVMAYLLGLEPQGLKPLAYRHAGMVQEDYADLTADAEAEVVFAWLADLYCHLPDTPEKLTKTQIKHGAVQGVLGTYDVEPAKAKKLIGRMLEKGSETLRARWTTGRAREVLVEEECYLVGAATDPPEATLDLVPLDKAVQYAGRDADATLRIFPHLNAEIDAFGLREVYEVDRAVIPMFDRMQQVGLLIDAAHFADVVELFKVEEAINLAELEAAAGRPVNPNSGDQVAELIYDERKVQERAINLKLKRTKSGERFSTNDKTLEALKALDPIIPLIQDGREIRKLRSTYAETIPRLVGADGRLHPHYRITRTDTGRPAASSPNVLALPKHSARGKLIRNGIIAAEGHELGEWDLSQIEMCVFAHDSEDAQMIAEIRSGLDKHATTAAGIFGRPVQDILAEYRAKSGAGDHQRFCAKAVNFGILMGITGFGLLDQFHKNGQLHWTLEDCEKLLADWFRMYPGAKAYIASKHAEARRKGYVRDMWGRLRWLEGIHSEDEYIRAEAERMAQATPTQSGAQGIIKRIMRELWPVLKGLRQCFWVEPLLQIHDALVLEYAIGEREATNAVMMAAMTGTVQLRVPVKASANFGLRLGEL